MGDLNFLNFPKLFIVIIPYKNHSSDYYTIIKPTLALYTLLSFITTITQYIF